MVVPTDDAGERLRATIGSLALVIEWDAHDIRVRTKRGQVLDPEAAGVLVSLGADPPPWLRIVEALRAVHRHHGADGHALLVATQVLGRSRIDIPREAKASTDPVVLTALAAAGHHQVAANPGCTSVAWDLLVGDWDPTVRDKARSLASTLPPALAGHRDPDVRRRVARNPSCSGDLLGTLARDPDHGVRTVVAANRKAPPSALAELGSTSDAQLQAVVGGNPSTPSSTLVRLARHKNPIVRATVAANLSLPKTSAIPMMWDAHGNVRCSLAGRTDLSPLALSWIERYARRDRGSYRTTLWRIAHNPAASKRLVHRVDRYRTVRPSPGTPTVLRPWVVVQTVTTFVSVWLLVEAAEQVAQHRFIEAGACVGSAALVGWLSRRVAVKRRRAGARR